MEKVKLAKSNEYVFVNIDSGCTIEVKEDCYRLSLSNGKVLWVDLNDPVISELVDNEDD